MKLSLQWLRRYTPIEAGTEEIARAITLLGFEVEGVQTLGLPALEGVQVGEVLEIAQHPNADKLSVCQVAVAPGEAPKTIVCGAKNFKVGDRVPVALPGARLPDGEGWFRIKKSKLRGVESEGMMCSARELGMGQDHAGLLILEQRPDIGTPIHAVFPDSDTVFDVEITPNRPDCLSHIGMARELAARFGLPLHDVAPDVGTEAAGAPLLEGVDLQSAACSLYYGFSLRGVKVGPSPAWLRQALESIGVNSINNVVDVTNFVLHEMGQPLHAFDAGKLQGQRLCVRQALPGERVSTLDGKERVLEPVDAVIADAGRAVAIAGVMGCADVEVDAATTEVFLEAAYFVPSFIRRTSRRLALSSDSAYRYERGVDAHRTELAARRAVALILEVAGGSLSGRRLVSGQPCAKPAPIAIRPGFLRDSCGFGPEDAVLEATLERLHLQVQRSGEVWNVGIPTWRRDLERPVDLVEEFLRLYGTERIPEVPVQAPGLLRGDAPLAQWLERAATLLADRQLHECYSYSTRDGQEVQAWYGEAHAESTRLANPLASDQSHLRPSLVPGLLDALRFNLHRGQAPRGLFEVGRVFRAAPEGRTEYASVAFVMPVELPGDRWKSREALDFYAARNLAAHVVELAGVRAAHHRYERLVGEPAWQEGHAACAHCYEGGELELRAGLVNLDMLKRWDIAVPVLAGEVLVRPEFFNRQRPPVLYKPFSAFPSSRKDIALLVDTWVGAAEVRDEVEGQLLQCVGGRFAVESVEVFDVYQGKGLVEGKKSLALALVFRAEDRTLTDAEVNAVYEDLRARIGAEGRYAVRA